MFLPYNKFCLSKDIPKQGEGGNNNPKSQFTLAKIWAFFWRFVPWFQSTKFFKSDESLTQINQMNFFRALFYFYPQRSITPLLLVKYITQPPPPPHFFSIQINFSLHIVLVKTSTNYKNTQNFADLLTTTKNIPGDQSRNNQFHWSNLPQYPAIRTHSQT